MKKYLAIFLLFLMTVVILSVCRSVAIPGDFFAAGMPQLLSRCKDTHFLFKQTLPQIEPCILHSALKMLSLPPRFIHPETWNLEPET